MIGATESVGGRYNHWLYEIRCNDAALVSATCVAGRVQSISSASALMSGALLALRLKIGETTETVILRRPESKVVASGDAFTIAESCGTSVIDVFSDDWMCSGSEAFLCFVEGQAVQSKSDVGPSSQGTKSLMTRLLWCHQPQNHLYP